MSTTDPDARARRVGAILLPAGRVSIVLGVLIAPIVAVWELLHPEIAQTDIGPFLIFLFVSVGAGIFAIFVPGKRSPLAIGAYIVSYCAGLFLVMNAGFGAFATDQTSIRVGYIVDAGIYAVAVFLVVLYVMRDVAAKDTANNGVDTTGTITSANIDGMINYVQHQRLTVKFTDNNGVDRWIKIGRTGGGYNVGDTVPLRYNPEHPGRKRAIVIGS